MRKFTELKCRLMPYLYATAVEAAKQGLPSMRAMVLEFEQDPTTWFLDTQYMLGGALLVAPIFREDGKASFYLPHGTWTHLLTGEKVTGGVWRDEHHDYMSLPLYVRDNTLLPIGARADRPDYRFAEGVELHLHELEEGKGTSVVIPDLEGKEDLKVHIDRKDSTLYVSAEGYTADWSLVLRGIREVQSVEGGAATEGPEGIRILPNEGTTELTIRL